MIAKDPLSQVRETRGDGLIIRFCRLETLGSLDNGPLRVMLADRVHAGDRYP